MTFTYVNIVVRSEPKPGPSRQHTDSLPTAILLDGLDDAPVVSETISDRIHFIFNNVSISNLDIKSNEMKEILKTDETLQYLAWYMVVKRVCIEHNYHQLYIAFLDKLKIPQLTT